MYRTRSLFLRTATIASLLLIAACSSSDISGPAPRATLLAEPTRNPILFVHGWNSTGAAWFSTIERFKADGWNDDELFNWTYYSGQSNTITAQQLGDRVDDILTLTGAAKVDVVTHSMGALSARYYIKNLGGGNKVDEFVSLGGPNHGTNTAIFCGQASCIEMRPNSSFLNALNRKDETPGRIIRYGTWWSGCDQVINPQTSTVLKGATNTQTSCIQHSDLHENTTIYGQVKAWVQ